MHDRLPVLDTLKSWINDARPAVALLDRPCWHRKDRRRQLFASIRERNDLDLGCVVYLSGLDYLPVTASTVLGLLRQALPTGAASQLLSDHVWESSLGWLESLDVLMDNLQTKVLLVVDQLEELVEPSGTLRDKGLGRLFQEIDQRSEVVPSSCCW